MVEAFVERLKKPFHDNGAVNIVCLGDSVTQGAFESGVVNAKVAYVAKLKGLLEFYFPEQVFNVINSGIGGTTATQAVARFDRDVLKYKPDLVFIMFGVNDCNNPAEYLNSLDILFKRSAENGIPAVYITEHMMNTYLASDTEPELIEHCKWAAGKQNDGTMDMLFAEGKRVAAENNVTVCDIYDKWKKLYEAGVDVTKLLANRTNHPIPEMHTLLANEILRTLLF